MKIPRIDPELLSLLTSSRFEQFTALELRDAFLQTPSPKAQNKNSARQFVHRNISRLEQKGFLERVGNSKDRHTEFRRTNKLSQKAVTFSKSKEVTASNGDGRDQTLDGLKEKLNYYKLEMLSTIGETEEYDALSKELPQMRVEIQELYNQARDRCSKNLGRVRALESLISHHKNA